MKRIYVLWRPPDLEKPAFARLLQERMAKLLALGPGRLVTNVADVPGASHAIPRPDGARVAGLVSAHFADDAAALDAARVLSTGGVSVGGYNVTEAIPLDYDSRDWLDGEPTPGVKQVTLLKRRPDLSYEEFIHRWHDIHTALAMRIHPLWAYNRNVVDGAFTPDAPRFDGIVELMFRQREELLDPARFFSGTDNIQVILDDVKSWLDFPAVEYYGMSETIVKSG